MKRIILILFVAISTLAYAKDAPSPVEEFNVNGLKVILKHSPNEVVNARFFIRGGTANYTKEKEGIEALAMNLIAEAGPASYTKDEFHQKLERMGTALTGNSTYDYSDISLTSVKKYWDESWKIFAEAITNPSFDEAEFNRLKEKMIANARQEESDPDSYVRKKALEYAFAGESYSRLAGGSEESLKNLTLKQVKDHYNKILTQSQSFIVVVGDIQKSDLEQKVRNAFASLKEGSYTAPKNTAANITQSDVKAGQREIATNYIRGTMKAPVVGSEDEIPMRLAMSILSDRLFVEIRTKRNLSYAPAAFYPNLKNSYAVLYVSTDKPNESVQVMLDEVKKIKEQGFDKSELEYKKSNFLTKHYMQLETNASQSEMLGQAELQGGWQRTEDFVGKVYDVDLEELNKVFAKYTNAIKWVYLGDTELVDEKVFKQDMKPEGEDAKSPY